jgi:hypothetical protein
MRRELPTATARSGPLRRLVGFLDVAPRPAVDGRYRWVLSLAGTSYAVHALYLVFVVLTQGSGGRDAALMIFLGLVFAVFLWMATVAAMGMAQVVGPALTRLPRRAGQLVGALWIAAVALAVEPVGGFVFRSLPDDAGWSRGFWILAGGIGALWGAWLPDAHRNDAR